KIGQSRRSEELPFQWYSTCSLARCNARAGSDIIAFENQYSPEPHHTRRQPPSDAKRWFRSFLTAPPPWRRYVGTARGALLHDLHVLCAEGLYPQATDQPD